MTKDEHQIPKILVEILVKDKIKKKGYKEKRATRKRLRGKGLQRKREQLRAERCLIRQLNQKSEDFNNLGKVGERTKVAMRRKNVK
jgi:hypothetical protein